MKKAFQYVAVYAGIFAAMWIALNVAGTDWSIPFAIAIVVVILFLMRKTA